MSSKQKVEVEPNVAHPPQCPPSCVACGALLLTMDVKSGWLSYCNLSVSSNQSRHFPLTSLINQALSP